MSRFAVAAATVTALCLPLLCSADRARETAATDAYFSERIRRVEANTSVSGADPQTFLREVQVTFDQDAKIRGAICAYPNAAAREPKAVISGPYAFHTMVGCKAAAWLAYHLHSFVASSPSFYGAAAAAATDDDNDDDNGDDNFDQPSRTDVAIDQKTLDRLIGALSRVTDADARGSLRTGAPALLRTAVSLAARARRDAASHDERAIVRLALGDMVDVQRFAATSCPKTTDGDPRLYGLWAPADGRRAGDEMADALTAVESLYVDQKPEPAVTCSVDRILSTRFVEAVDRNGPHMDDVVAVITRTERVTLKALRERALTSGDAAPTFWYHDFTLMAVVKVIVDKVRLCLDVHTWTKQITEDVQEINSRLSDGERDTDEYLAQAFDVLSRATNSTNDDVRTQLGELYDSLDDVELTETSVMDGNPASCDGDLVIVQSYLHIIFNNIHDLNCFIRFFKSVRLERRKYYIPFIKNKPVLLPTEKDDKSEEGCEFVKNVYFVCYRAYFLFNKYVDNKSDNSIRSRYLLKFWDVVREVSNYFIIIIKKSTSNTVINKIAYDAATILQNLQPQQIDRNSLEFEVKRVLNVIMNEMNSYDITYCYMKNPTFLIFNKINLYEFGDHTVTKRSLETYLENNLHDYTVDDLNFYNSITSEDYQFLSAQYIYSKFIKNSNYYDTYGMRIKFNWKGSLQTLGDIFQNESLLILNVHHYYELYDVYFKYCAAAIFYPARDIVLGKSKLKDVHKYFEEIKEKLSKHGDWVANFPPDMKSFLLKIVALLDLPAEMSRTNKKLRDSQAMSKLREEQESIEKQFTKFNVIFKKTSKIKKFSLKVICGFKSKNEIEDYLIVFKELLETVKIVFNNFSKIYHTSILTDHYNNEQAETDKEDDKPRDLEILSN